MLSRWIVIVWTEVGQEIVKPGRVDIGERHTFRDVDVARAATWRTPVANDDPADYDRSIARAEGYARAEGGRVVTFLANETDPLGQAKFDALANAAAKRHEARKAAR